MDDNQHKEKPEKPTLDWESELELLSELSDMKEEMNERFYELTNEFYTNPFFNNFEELNKLTWFVLGYDVDWIKVPRKITNEKVELHKGKIFDKFFDNFGTFMPLWVVKEIRENYSPTFYAGQFLYRYENGVYKPDGENYIRQLLISLLRDQARRSRIEEVIYLLRNDSWVDPNKINPDDGLINVKNGLLDWRSGELLPHTADRLSTIQLPVEFDPFSDDPSVMEFIKNIIQEDTIDLIFELIGYCLIPSTKYEKASMFTGSGGNGKSTLINMLTSLLGRDNISTISIQDIETNRFKLAQLQGKLVNTFADLPRRSLDNASNFKSIVSGDIVNAEHKGKDPFDFKPYAKLIFSTNELPRSSDLTEGFFRRWIIIPFTRKFTPDTADVDLVYKITTPSALSTLLNYAVAGLKRLEANGKFTESETTKNALEQYRRDIDNVVLFVEEKCIVGENESCLTTVLYETYRLWSKDAGLHSLGRTNFNKRIDTKYKLEKTRVKGESSERWLGIGLK